jgi:hypothetical protein
MIRQLQSLGYRVEPASAQSTVVPAWRRDFRPSAGIFDPAPGFSTLKALRRQAVAYRISVGFWGIPR